MPTDLRVLVIELAFPGDAVLSIVLAEELNRLDPTLHISYLVRPDVVDLLRRAPSIDQVIPFDKRSTESGTEGIRKKASELNEQEFDLIYVLHSSTRTLRLVSLLNATKKRFLQAFPEGATTDTPLLRTKHLLTILKQDYPSTELTTLPRIVPPDIAASAWLNLLPDRFVAMAPGSMWQTKCWPVAKFAQVAKALVEKGIAVVLVGGPRDVEIGAEIAKGLPLELMRDLTGQTTLLEAASVIATAQLLLANDSAPVHIATSVRTYTIVIFGPTVPAFGFRPPPKFGEVVELAGLWCRPCTSHGPDKCPIYTHDCMNLIDAETVIARVEAKLAEQFTFGDS